ncbi:carboxypeptidase Y-deficient [Actinomortierella ambigua]|nr:carboxypeptidase Y-deficient [Actinomortierella ambigua]
MASPAPHSQGRPRRQFGLPQQQQQQQQQQLQTPQQQGQWHQQHPHQQQLSSSRSGSPGTPTPSYSQGPASSPGPPAVPPKSPSPLVRPTSTASPAPAPVSEPLTCPICEQTLPNLYLLNLHLDARHTEETDEFKTAVSNFFRNAQKVFNPIAKNASTTIKNIPANSSELLRRIQDLDLDSPDGSNSSNGSLLGTFSWTDPRADAVVTKRHWVRESLDRETCSRKNCGKTLGIRYGRQNCRSCGQLYCDTHTMFQLKLDANAHPDPSGLCLRAKHAEKIRLESNRLEKRIEKLAVIHQKHDPTGSATSSPTLSATGTWSDSSSPRAADEQTVVKWEDDSSVPACHICLSMFTRYGNRKHHCRLCGRVICANCSTKIPLYLNMSSYCYNTVFKRREHASDQKKTKAVVKYYDSLIRLRDRIDVTLPRFQEMVATIGQKSNMHKEHPDYQLAAKTRKELLDDFALFDAISKRIHALPATSVHQKQLQNNLHWWATQYLQTNMFPLSVIPKLFQNQGDGSKSSLGTGGGNGENSNGNGRDGTKQDMDSSTLPSLPTIQHQDEKTMEALALISVLEEQRTQVESFIEDANRRRRFDDVKALKQSLDELEAEIGHQKKIAGLV